MVNAIGAVDYLHSLDTIQPAQRSLVGEPAFRLSQLHRQGYPVLPGLVIDGSCYAKAVAATSDREPLLAQLWQQPERAPTESVGPLQQQATAACQAMKAAPALEVATAVAVALSKALMAWPTTTIVLRPSFSFPGAERQPLLDLLVARSARRDRLAEVAATLQQLWAEVFTGQNLFYWHKAGVPIASLRLAVLVQPLLAAAVTGQVRANPERWEIEAVSGLGQSLTRGEANPERCILDPCSGRVIARQPGQQTRHYQPTATLVDAIESIPLATHLAFPLLNDNRLEQLTEVLQQLATDTPEFELEWIFGAGEAPLQIGQWSPILSSAIATKPPPQPAGRGCLRGLAAAPGRAIAPAYLLDADEGTSVLSPGWIVVARQIAPTQLPLLKQASGVILEEGGLTSHGAILARELGIPAVVGVPAAMAMLHPGQTLALDGDRGEIDPDPPAEPLPEPEPTVAADPIPETPDSDRPASTQGTQLFVNLSQPASAAAAARFSVDGVGLLRADLLLLAATDRQPLATWLQPDRRERLLGVLVSELERIVVPFAPRPIFYRACDWLEGEVTNSSWLGQRGTGRIQQDPTLFDLELAAIAQLRQRGHPQIKLVLPFVRSVEEFQFCRQRAIAAGLSATEIWLMAEVPSALLLLPEYAAAGAAGIAIGTNDLTQLLLGVDREAPTRPYDERHPAMLAALERAIGQARELGLQCSLCGQMVAHFPDTVDDLIRWGVTAISVEPAAVGATARAIARAERRLLLEAARQLGWGEPD